MDHLRLLSCGGEPPAARAMSSIAIIATVLIAVAAAAETEALDKCSTDAGVIAMKEYLETTACGQLGERCDSSGLLQTCVHADTAAAVERSVAACWLYLSQPDKRYWSGMRSMLGEASATCVAAGHGPQPGAGDEGGTLPRLAGVPPASGAAAPAAAAGQCNNNCTHLNVVHGYLLPDPKRGGKRTFVGLKWSAIQTLLDERLGAVGGLPGLDANAATMRQLTLTGNYVADVPLSLPSRLHFRLNGKVHGNLSAASQAPDACKDGRCALVDIGPGVSFVSVTGGDYTCEGGTAYGVSCQGCDNALIQNLTVTGCGQGNIHFYSAGPAIEIKNVEGSHSNRGVWSQTPSHKVLITGCYFHDNFADGVDLDSMSKNVMIRNNRLENNGRCGVFIEEGAADNIIVDNHFSKNGFGIGFFTNLGGKDLGEYPTANHWVVGNTFVENGAAFSLGGMKQNGATDNLFAENTIHGNDNSWIVCSVLHNYTECLAAPAGTPTGKSALVGNHVLTSDTDDARSARLLSYGSGNVTFFAEPPPALK